MTLVERERNDVAKRQWNYPRSVVNGDTGNDSIDWIIMTCDMMIFKSPEKMKEE